jgi:uncharacterized protein with LGFP repeats
VITTGSTGFAVQADFLAIVDAGTGTSVLGSPVGSRVALPTAKNGTGTGQTFQNGTIYASSAGAFAVLEPMRSLYARNGSYAGRLGFPTSAQTCHDRTCTQAFQHGTLSTAALDDSAVTMYWLASGGSRGPLGPAKGSVVSIPATTTRGAGLGQTFTNGTVFSSAAGTFAILTAMRTVYSAHQSYNGPLGWPTTDQACVSGECTQQFEHGVIFNSTSRGGRVLLPDYAAVYDNGNSGLGVPLANPVALPSSVNGAGRGQSFANGTIYEGPAGPFAVLKAVRDVYATVGSYNGRLGWPTGARTCVSGECIQPFQHGYITHTASGAGYVVDGPYADAYDTGGGFAALGAASTARIATSGANGSGSGQVFRGGAIYSSAAGTFAVPAALRTEYLKLGGNTGSLGWPTAAASCSGGDCGQAFSGGLLYVSSDRGARVVSGAYRTALDAGGGIAVLGVPLSAPVAVTGNPNGDGEGQPFANGTIYTSAAGTLAVIRPLRDEYWAQGSNSGPLGWPVGAQTCTGGTCTQQFQGGSITK